MYNIGLLSSCKKFIFLIHCLAAAAATWATWIINAIFFAVRCRTLIHSSGASERLAKYQIRDSSKSIVKRMKISPENVLLWQIFWKHQIERFSNKIELHKLQQSQHPWKLLCSSFHLTSFIADSSNQQTIPIGFNPFHLIVSSESHHSRRAKCAKNSFQFIELQLFFPLDPCTGKSSRRGIIMHVDAHFSME